MELSKLLINLKDKAFTFEKEGDPDAEVYNVALLSPEMTIRPDVLYFCNASLLPESIGEDSFLNVAVYGDASTPPGLVQAPNVNIIRLARSADPHESYNRVQSYFLEDQRLTAIVRIMLQAHFSNRGIQYLVEEAAKALGNPVVVADTSYRYIAYYVGDLVKPGTPTSKVLHEELEYESILEEGVDYIHKQRIDDSIGRMRRPLTRYNSHLQCDTITGAVIVHGICIAHVMMLATAHPFTELENDCFLRLVDFVGQELQKTSLYETNKGQMDSYFLLSLLTDEQPSQVVIERRLRVLNYHPKETLYVVCLSPQDPSRSSTFALDTIASQLRSILSHDIYCKHEGSLVVLMNRDAGEPLGEYAESVMSDVAELNDLSVGISAPFSNLVETRRFYDQARAAIKYGAKIEHALTEGRLHHYPDLAYVQMIDVCGQSRNLLDFCHPAIIKLLRYDEEHGSEMLETLFCYLQNSNSTSRASKMLSLHKNTLLYRLGRIREICGIDLTSGEEVFNIQLSFRVLLYLGMFVPRLQNVRSELHE